MGCLGVHFSIDDRIVGKLKAYKRESARLNYVIDKLEEEYFDKYPEWFAETDKAWDAIHRALTDGRLAWNNGEYPLNHVILAGELLYTKGDYIMSLKMPQQVQDVARALRDVTKESFKNAYFRIDPEQYGFPVDEQDFEYTWDWFGRTFQFWFQAANEGRFVLFTADQ